MEKMNKIKVAIRARPLLPKELEKGAVSEWTTSDRTIRRIGTSVEEFSFDHVFGESDDTMTVYEKTVHPIVETAMQGYNGTVFAYGQTSSGKTYTIMGNAEKRQPGLIHLVLDDIFDAIQQNVDREYLLRVSYMEIYNEKVHDLLAAQKGGAKDTRQELRLLEKDKGQVYVEGLEERMISDYQAAVDSIAEAQTFRRIGSTNANEFSSRSHTIFRVIIESRQKSNEDAAISVSYLNIVDLAGSENANQSGMGDRLLEGANINKSLHALSRVIFQLSEGKSEESDKHVSFRDSKLTRILKSSLGGNAKTLTLCMVAPCAIAETISTIKFAMSAGRVENRPVKNEVLTEDALLRRYKRENERLKKRLEATGVEQLESENVQLNEEVKRLREAVENIGQHIISSKSLQNSPYAKERKMRRQTWCPGQSSVGRSPLQLTVNGNVSSVGASASSSAADASFESIDRGELMLDFAMKERDGGLFQSPGSMAIPRKRQRPALAYQPALGCVNENEVAAVETGMSVAEIVMQEHVKEENQSLKDQVVQLQKEIDMLRLQQLGTNGQAVSGGKRDRGRYLADPNLEESVVEETMTGQMLIQLVTPRRPPTSHSVSSPLLKSAKGPEAAATADDLLSDVFEKSVVSETEEIVGKGTDFDFKGKVLALESDDVLSEQMKFLHDRNRELEEMLQNAQAMLQGGLDDSVRGELEKLLAVNEALTRKCAQLESSIASSTNTVISTAEASTATALQNNVHPLQSVALSPICVTNGETPRITVTPPDPDVVELCQKLLLENETLSNENKALQKRNMSLECTVETLQDRNAGLEKSADERQSLTAFEQQELEIVQSDLKRAIEQTEKWKKDAEDSAAIVKDVHCQLEKLKTVLATETQKHEALQSAFNSTVKELEKVKRDVVDFEYMVELERKNGQSKVRDLQTVIGELEAKTEAMETSLDEQQQLKLEQCQFRETESKNEIDKLTKEISEVNSCLETAKAKIGRLEIRIKHLETECDQFDELETALNETAYDDFKKIEHLQSQLAKHESSVETSEAIESLKSQVATLYDEKENYRLENVNLGMRSAGLERSLRSQDKQHKSELSRLEQDLAEKEQRIGKLKDQLRDANQRASDSEDKFALRRQRSDKSSRHVAETSTEQFVEQFNLQEERHKNYALSRKVGELESNLKTAQEKIGDLQRELLEARREQFNISKASVKENETPVKTPRSASRFGSLLRSSKRDGKSKSADTADQDKVLTCSEVTSPKQSSKKMRASSTRGEDTEKSPNSCRQQ